MNKYLGLLHHPVLGRKGEIITTSVTNLDIHDIARTCRTFGFKKYFIITPVEKQHQLIQTILDHWNTDVDSSYNPDRTSALSYIEISSSYEDALKRIEEIEGTRPATVATGANFKADTMSEEDVCKALNIDNTPMFLIFGTGWGLHASLTEGADYRLHPIFGVAEDGYNHLSVRSAVAIYSDRIARSL